MDSSLLAEKVISFNTDKLKLNHLTPEEAAEKIFAKFDRDPDDGLTKDQYHSFRNAINAELGRKPIDDARFEGIWDDERDGDVATADKVAG